MRKRVLSSIAVLFMLCSAAFGDLVDNGDGTVTDTQTGLMWQQAEAGAMNWEAALTYCEDLDLAGHSDWRLPNRNELQSIVDYATYNPSIDTTLFPTAVSSAFWSSTTHVGDSTDSAWVVTFDDSQFTHINKSSGMMYVRAVRGGQ